MKFTDWKGVFTLAQELGGKNTEAAFRSSINRTYYSCYNLSCAFCDIRNIYKKKANGEDHEFLVKALKQHRNDEVKKVGGNLNKLRGKRIHADYNSSEEVTKGDSDFSLKLGDELIKSLDFLSKAISL